MLVKRDEDGELRPPRWELEEGSYEDVAAMLADGTITRARAIKLAGAALLAGSGMLALFQSPAEAGRRRKKKKRRRRRRSITTRVRTNRRRVRFRDTPAGTTPETSPVQNVTITNPGTQPISIEPVFSSPDFTLAPGFTFPDKIAAGNSVEVPIVFTPQLPSPTTSTGEVRTGELTFVDTGGSPVVIVDANNNTVDAIELKGTALPAV
jgi:hypothetical protein